VHIRYRFTGLDRPLGLQEFEDRRISRQPANEGSNVVCPSHRSILSDRIYLCHSFLLDDESTPGSYCGRKN